MFDISNMYLYLHTSLFYFPTMTSKFGACKCANSGRSDMNYFVPSEINYSFGFCIRQRCPFMTRFGLIHMHQVLRKCGEKIGDKLLPRKPVRWSYDENSGFSTRKPPTVVFTQMMTGETTRPYKMTT